MHRVSTSAVVRWDEGQAVAPVLFAYDPADPYAVSLSFETVDDGPVTWTFGRELLLLGLERQEGIGSVQVGVSDSGLEYRLRLTAPGGQAEFTFPTEAIVKFLTMAYHAVPQGRENVGEALDAALADMLA